MGYRRRPDRRTGDAPSGPGGDQPTGEGRVGSHLQFPVNGYGGSSGWADRASISWVQPVWLQPPRDRTPLKYGGKAPARGIAPRPEAYSTGHYSQPRAEAGRSGDLS